MLKFGPPKLWCEFSLVQCLRPEILSDGEEQLMRFLNMPKAHREKSYDDQEIKGSPKAWWKKGGVDSLKSIDSI